MTQTFNGKVALITGAARGIGAGVSRGFVAKGGKVALLGLEPELLTELSEELGESAAWWEADVRDSEAMKTAIDAAAKHFGQIDFVLANAGIASYGTVRQISDDAFERVVDININGVFRTLKYATPYLEKTDGYALVVASQASFAALAGLASYNASKAGAEMLAIAYKQEVAHLGIGVGVCHPSWVDTDIVRVAEADLPTFKAVRKKLPWPSNATTSIEDCIDLILKGFEKRKARVYVKKSVLVSNWTKPLMNSPLAWPLVRKIAAGAVPQMEKEVDALGRFHHSHTPVTKPAE
ncbi:NAD(P)-dependent dehydrogenase (short-subunit alcohol dehydrogenase family) [Aeromicrobium panaciterrae]|uniref:NAD(P)-dependent dehydrogenase (Short-subunit alcohol dehydrogenase family) n=1 Tax=Aeromicrobium panaciterrae TaxID=363861 RepID=A0ABU1UJS1_9ACTN|nr:short-chain dehydrogenase/reductase [Aeromicrobium panaciterrae]MDR7085418.1 NAD(P)-dependent dehydrogenase (short-subunit alcohol dehydrogenase family) [Aeromicrobium panaciterrae]